MNNSERIENFTKAQGELVNRAALLPEGEEKELSYKNIAMIREHIDQLKTIEVKRTKEGSPILSKEGTFQLVEQTRDTELMETLIKLRDFAQLFFSNEKLPEFEEVEAMRDYAQAKINQLMKIYL